ncbi:MAG: hypothetical protein GTN89_10380 [Acidobacteria bacterium]|nr:hypothetical protein [Acidobacteriota bacterium]NIM60445.1 hypothetical protein [Acidobacteriota bacterium]NIO59663.1 hypothetical protein [Acidobacteriota bacterium]NIQ30757.1 hypothetical protein [Acidobacteriota bacterium]NIQ84382.1 hypothetical protein [Acidobacteriota bacterium]
MSKRAEAVVEAIRRALTEKGIDTTVGPDTAVDGSLGLDSLDWAAIVVELESELGVDPFVDGIERELKTIQDLIEVYNAA